LIACEFSEIVKEQFLLLGLDAHSCDLLPGVKHLPHHHQCDVGQLLNDSWDILIGHPPCTDLAVSGARYFAVKRANGRQQSSIDFFMMLVNAPIPHIAIENPIGIMSTIYRKPDQIIQPWQFGHPETKATCLWLKNLSPLTWTNDVRQLMATMPTNQKQRVHYMSPGPERWKNRSLTLTGIAQAMANQWSKEVAHSSTG
jgi:site-specific DNA-cytosine methylase